MFVIGRIEDAGRQQHDGRIGRGGRRRDRLQRRQQLVGIILDRRHAVAREQFREKPQHDLAVFQHVGHARRRARIVLEHVEIVGVDAHDVDAGDMHIDVVRHLLPVHFRAEDRVLENQILGHDAGLEHFAPVIDVLDISVDRLDPLLEPALQSLPFGRGEDARNDVERDQALLRLGVAVDRKGNADAPKEVLGLAAAEIEHVRGNFAQPVRQLGVGRPHRAFAAPHLVEHSGPRPTRARSRNACRINGGNISVAIFAPRKFALGQGKAGERRFRRSSRRSCPCFGRSGVFSSETRRPRRAG